MNVRAAAAVVAEIVVRFTRIPRYTTSVSYSLGSTTSIDRSEQLGSRASFDSSNDKVELAMTNIVFVPGGWQGGWRNAAVAQRLRAQGYQVFTPTLTGLGERVHLANSSINLDTHIEDVANVLRFEDLTDVILCGHSYAGMVISGVADKLFERISALVYIDAFVPQDGDSWWDLAGDGYRQLALERSELDGFRVTPPAHLDPRCTPHPLASFRQAIRLKGQWKSVKEKVFIYATGWKDTPFTSTYEALLLDPEWAVKSFACGHNVVREDPEQLIAVITDLKVSQRAE